MLYSISQVLPKCRYIPTIGENFEISVLLKIDLWHMKISNRRNILAI